MMSTMVKLHHLGPKSIRTRLLLAVNVVLVVGLGVVLVVDCRRELSDRLHQKRGELAQQAEIILPAVQTARAEGPAAIQHLIDAACARMQEGLSPGHHIAVQFDGQVLQARTHQRASPEHFQAMVRAVDEPRWQSDWNDHAIIVASRREGDMVIYVSEFVDNVYAGLWQHLLIRLGGMTALGLTITALVNLVLLRVVTRPLERLVHTVRQIGQGEWGAQAPALSSTEFQYLAGEINVMSRSLARAEGERQHQLARAKRIQDHLLPRPTAVEGLKLAMLTEPASEVGGDHHDLIRLPDGSWLIFLADVTGHGVPAAMGAAILKALLAAVGDAETDPAIILERINRRFHHVTLDEDFATAIVLRWIPQESRVEYASAGHETAYVVSHAGELNELTSTGLPLGVDAEATWVSNELPLGPGDRLVLYTDGLTEARSPAGELFGRAKLRATLTAAEAGDAESLSRSLQTAIARHRRDAPADDDLTLVVLEAVAPHATESSDARVVEPFRLGEPATIS